MLKGVIFDFDGTLIDSTDSIWEEYVRVSKIMGLREISFTEFARHLGRPWDDVLKNLWPGIDVHEFTRHYRMDRENTTLLAHVPETLQKLKKKYVLALLTSRGMSSLYKHLESVGIPKEYFKAILHRESVRRHKPDADALLHACEKMNLAPLEVVYVGDAIVDAECARNAGITFIGVTTGGASTEDFKRFGAKHIIGSMEKLPDVLSMLK